MTIPVRRKGGWIIMSGEQAREGITIRSFGFLSQQKIETKRGNSTFEKNRYNIRST